MAHIKMAHLKKLLVMRIIWIFIYAAHSSAKVQSASQTENFLKIQDMVENIKRKPNNENDKNVREK